ncbi:MAG TPA: M23 family metallopeptidase [Dehalococcoidia bacterium]|nr:M23 family metallopeptidase [Dehalococcoidia bacterium]
MPSPKLQSDDGLTPLQRLQGHLGQSERWIRYSTPVGRVLLALGAVAGIGGLGAFAFSVLNNSSDKPPPNIRVVRVATAELPTPTVTPGPPPAQVIEQPVNVEIWRASTFAWPAAGRISAFFGLGDRTGITIETEPGGEVLASSRGIVKSVGAAAADRHSIVIEHEGGLKSLYANVADPTIEAGQRIERRQPIGKAGPGRAGRGQIHFELLSGTEALDPLRYLPTTAPDPLLAKPESSSCPTTVLAADPASSLNLIFSSDALRSYSIKEASVRSLPDGSQKDIEARPKGQLSLAIDVRPRAPGSSRSVEYVLEAIFGNGTDLRSATCRLSLNTATLIPGSGPSALSIAPTPPRPSTATPVPGTATVTPTRTKTPTRTPTGSRTVTATAKTTGTAKTGTPKRGTAGATQAPATPKKGTPAPSKSGTPASPSTQ